MKNHSFERDVSIGRFEREDLLLRDSNEGEENFPPEPFPLRGPHYSCGGPKSSKEEIPRPLVEAWRRERVSAPSRTIRCAARYGKFLPRKATKFGRQEDASPTT